MDYLELYRQYGCILQTGGSDQWGNITAGVDLIHKAEGVSVHALATPLLLKADGTKFGKTESGTVWLSADLMTPYAFYQFFLNSEDAMVISYLKVFSFRSREEIEELERLTAEKPQMRAAQKALAEEVTTLVHGPEATAQVIAASKALFGQGDLAELDEPTLRAALAELPGTKVSELVPVAQLLADTGLVASRGAGRRTINEGGAYVNNRKIEAEDETPTKEDLLHGRWLVLRRGKRTLGAVEVGD
jgi:tyrosyl-tRNA synthetase